MEVWKDIPGYEGFYQVSNLGVVKSLQRRGARERILKTATDWGYHHVDLCKDGKAKRFYVHRLVALAFIENPESKTEVNHINGIKTDNRAENLEWSTYSENLQHAYENGLNPNTRSVMQYDLQGNLIGAFASIHEAGIETKTHYQDIWRCCNGKRKTAGGYKWQYTE